MTTFNEEPHMFLRRVAQGRPIEHTRIKPVFDDDGNFVENQVIQEDVYPDFRTRLYAAEKAAPYFAPKLANTVVQEKPIDFSAMLREVADRLPG